MNSRAALIVVHALPPNLGTANVYGMRSSDPMRLGTSVKRNSSETESVMPMLARLRTTIVHSTHTLKPMCSANMEKARFLLATFSPVLSQKDSLSGSQSSIQRCLFMYDTQVATCVGRVS